MNQKNSHRNSKTYSVLFALVILALVTSGCEAFKPKPAALSNEQVGLVTENILQALNQVDYADFKRDFSDQMLSAFSEAEFNKLRDLLQKTSGNYLSRGEPNLLNQQGFAIYRFPCKFDKEDVTVTVTFAIDGDKVGGLFFDSANLRKSQ